MADYRSLEIKVAHARHLKNVNFLSDMDPYVVVSLSCDPQTRLRTPVHRTGNKNPTWNFPLRFSVHVADPNLPRHTLDLTILCERTLGDKPIGTVHVSFSDLLTTIKNPKPCHVAYQVRRPSGRAKGELSFSYKWGKNLPTPLAAPTALPLPVEVAVTPYPSVVSSSGFHQAQTGSWPAGPGQYQHAPLGGYTYQYPPEVGCSSHPLQSYVAYPPSHQYGGYPQTQPAPQVYHQTGYGYTPMPPPPKRNNTRQGLDSAMGYNSARF